LMGTSVQSYAAFGLLQRHGLSPYDFGPNRLTGERVVAAIEPGARGTPSATGPLGTLLQHLAVSISSGSALGAVFVLRGIALIAAVVIGRLAADIAGTGVARSRALTLTVLNPLLLLYVVSAARLEGVMLALVLAAIAAANQRRWLAAIALTCVAGSVLGEAFLLLPVILAVHLLGRRTVSTWLLLGGDLLVAGVTTALAGLVVRNGFGWLWTVDNQFSAHTPFSITTAIAKLLTPIVRGASYDDLAAGARITAMTAMVCVLSYLIGTARQRALERTAGYSLLALALLAPVLYPWYLLWGTTCLAPTANGSRRVAVLALCAAGALITPPGFTPTTSNVITGIALALVAVAVVVPARVRRTSRPAVPVSAGT
jgi:alpha-1,6-mannosyltransferase